MFVHVIDEDAELRLLQPNDAEKLFKLVEANRAHLKAWLPWLDMNQTVEDTVFFIKKSLQEFAAGEGVSAGIYFKGALVGIISLMNIDHGNKKVEIGYWLGKDWEGKGLMTAACRAFINYAFGDLALNRVTIRCAEANEKSRAVPMRLGFREEGCLKDNEWLYDHYVSHIIYGITANEWVG